MEVGEVVERRVAGVAAAQWDFVLEAGQVEQQVREIVFVRGDAAWRVQLQADSEGFDLRGRGVRGHPRHLDVPLARRLLRSDVHVPIG